MGTDTVEIIEGTMTATFPCEEGAIEVVMLFDPDPHGQRETRVLGA